MPPTGDLRYAALVEALRRRAAAEQNWKRWDEIVEALISALPADQVARANAQLAA